MKKGKIIRIISNLYTVETTDGLYECRARGKFRNMNITPLVGDFVVIDSENKLIMEILPRNNELTRPVIANVDVALIMTSVKEPNLSLNLLDKQLCCIKWANIEPVICLSKLDLLETQEKNEIDKVFEYYDSIGIKVFNNTDVSELSHYLKNKTVVLTGQTGAGKSTFINKLDSSLNLETNPISKALGRGVHTTRHVELYKIRDMFIADTPGFSALDLNFSRSELKNVFSEFADKTCKYRDCEHIKENDCGVREAVENGEIMVSRYENYVKFWSDMK